MLPRNGYPANFLIQIQILIPGTDPYYLGTTKSIQNSDLRFAVTLKAEFFHFFPSSSNVLFLLTKLGQIYSKYCTF
jgi:hypothetical protein